MNDPAGNLILIFGGILLVTMLASVVIAVRIPRLETLLKGLYEESKTTYDELQRRNHE
jgi:hypothetical protein